MNYDLIRSNYVKWNIFKKALIILYLKMNEIGSLSGKSTNTNSISEIKKNYFRIK